MRVPLLGLALLAGACAPEQEFAPLELRPDLVQAALRHSPLGAVPTDSTNAWADDVVAASLGERLFFEQQLSRGGRFSCASCHDPARAFSDGRAVGVGWARGLRNVPSLLNVAFQRWFAWDGRTDSLWAQAAGPLEGAWEMGSTRLDVVRVVLGDRSLQAAYREAFHTLPVLTPSAWASPPARPVPVAPGHPHHQAWLALGELDQDAVNEVFTRVCKALAAFERRLVSRSSDFDSFVARARAGDPAAGDVLGQAALRGFDLFTGRGRCASCHSGPLFSDEEFHDVRLPLAAGPEPGRYEGLSRLLANEFRSDGIWSDDPDAGRRRLRGLRESKADLGGFRTPSLRNVALTAPYMHDGRFASLGDVVDWYSHMDGARALDELHGESILQPLELTPDEASCLVAFLVSLTDSERSAGR